MRRTGLLSMWLLATATWLAAGPARADAVEEIIVTGTRATDHTSLTSAVPISVISADSLQATGYTDLGRALEFSEPSLNLPRPQTTPSSASTRPITLRGLSPDEVLVLVNGKRWHSSAVINTNFAVGRGSAPFDLSTLPVSAIDRVEVLRDGAAAQYGSDAIAGVVNIILKSNGAGGFAAAQAGVTERGDGANGTIAFNRGFSFGEDGRLTLSGQAGYDGATNRAAVDQRYGRVDWQIGAPEVQNGAVAASVAAGGFYNDLLAARKDATNAVTYGTPGLTPLYPNGFLPKVNPLIWDVGDTAGFHGDLPGDIQFDLSNTFGLSEADFTVRDTANVSQGLASATTFNAGSVVATQDVVNLTLTRPFSDGNLALGGEYRHDSYRINRGETNAIAGSGAQGFPGFNPRLPVDVARNAAAGFADAEWKPAPWLALGAAARYDHYDDFGGDLTWKGTARVQANDWLAFRGSASTGFRAPSLQQEYWSSITTVANGANKALVNVGTFQVNDPVARALGATPLRAEKSRDETIGVEFTPDPAFTLTADLFRTDIDHRIAYSDALTGPAVLAALRAATITNVQQVAFFTNALNTRTEGYDVTARTAGRIDRETGYTFTLGYERSPTQIRSLRANPVLRAPSFIGTHARVLLTEAQPADKVIATFTLDHGPYTGTLNATRYGEYKDAPVLDVQKFSAKIILDLSLTAAFTDEISATLGVLNLGDVAPDRLRQQALAYKTFGNSYQYGEETPWGVDGRAYYVRMTVRF